MPAGSALARPGAQPLRFAAFVRLFPEFVRPVRDVAPGRNGLLSSPSKPSPANLFILSDSNAEQSERNRLRSGPSAAALPFRRVAVSSIVRRPAVPDRQIERKEQVEWRGFSAGNADSAGLRTSKLRSVAWRTRILARSRLYPPVAAHSICRGARCAGYAIAHSTGSGAIPKRTSAPQLALCRRATSPTEVRLRNTLPKIYLAATRRPPRRLAMRGQRARTRRGAQ